MYREVVRSSQYAAQKRAFVQVKIPDQSAPSRKLSLCQRVTTNYLPKHHPKGSMFKIQSRNSRSQPNLLSLSNEYRATDRMSQLNVVNPALEIAHARTNSQPIEYPDRRQMFAAKSTHNLFVSPLTNGQGLQNPLENPYDPIYALPVKPFLSSQDVRVNSNFSVPPAHVTYAQPAGKNPNGYAQFHPAKFNQQPSNPAMV